MAGDLRVRFDATVRTGVFEALDYSAHADLVASAVREMGGWMGPSSSSATWATQTRPGMSSRKRGGSWRSTI